MIVGHLSLPLDIAYFVPTTRRPFSIVAKNFSFAISRVAGFGSFQAPCSRLGNWVIVAFLEARSECGQPPMPMPASNIALRRWLFVCEATGQGDDLVAVNFDAMVDDGIGKPGSVEVAIDLGS